MSSELFRQWLKSQQAKLDVIIADAGKRYWNGHKGHSNFAFDLNECQHESYNLIRGKDLCYDRPNTAFAYSLWYHARRVNTFLSHFGSRMLEAQSPNINVFDLGAGTGAVQWSVGLFIAFMKSQGKPTPHFRLVNVDISPFMLEYNQAYLWPEFLKHYPEVSASILAEYKCNSWMNTDEQLSGENWLSASYLFDISDADADPESNYSSAVQKGFKDLVEAFNPSKALLLTSSQPKKEELLKKVVDELSGQQYIAENIGAAQLWIDGCLNTSSAFRKELYHYYSSNLFGSEGRALGNSTSWRDGSFMSCCITKKQQTLLESRVLYRTGQKEVSLFNPPIRVRKNVVLNAEQQKAATHTDRHTIITGPAGCGKSVIITERIKNLVEEKNYNTDLKILISTFNKELIGYLLQWVVDLLDDTKFRRMGEHLHFNNSPHPNISFLHFDVLPTRIGSIYGDLIFEFTLKEYATAAISEIKAENKITTSRYDAFLQPGYIVEEYHRIIYGLQYVKEEEFLVSERKGREPRLRTNGKSRELLWKTCMRFLEKIQASPYDSTITKRHKLLKKLKDGIITARYTHIFIDEYQDCTQADYEIFDKLLLKQENLVMAGDFAQAVHLGKAAELPRLKSQIDMGRRHRVKLKGSYRLPYRISEAISPLSKLVQDGNVITPFKAAPPGARPIVVFAKNDIDFRVKIVEIFRRYKVYGADEVTILEKDSSIQKLLSSTRINASSDTILRLKGMEKPFILWSTRADVEHPDDVEEFVYTILSRTSGVLIIALFPNTQPKFYSIMRHLDIERLIFWDSESKDAFSSFKKIATEAKQEAFQDD